MNLKRMTLNEIASLLGYKDTRSAELWCRQNNITIEYDRKKKYVWNKEFEFAMNNRFLKLLESKHPDNYMDVYHSLQKNDFLNAYQLTNQLISTPTIGEYTPLGNSSLDFLQSLN